MNSFDVYENFNISRILSLSIGLWPYYKSKLTKLQIIIYFSILGSFTVFQFTALLTTKCTPEFVITVFSSGLSSIVTLMMYISFIINSSNVKYLLMELQQTCHELRDENEIAIIKHYGSNARHDTIMVTIFGIIFIIMVQFALLHTFLPNFERHRTPFLVLEYFIDQEKYFYLIYIHINAAMILTLITILSTGTTLLIYLKYMCGMFKIASYRIEQIIKIDVQYNMHLKDTIMFYKNIVGAIDIHRKAMMLSTLVMKYFEGTFCITVLLLVSGMSLNLYRVFRIVSNYHNDMKIVIHFGYITAILIFIFLANYTAQQIIDHNEDLFVTVYNIHWYIKPLYIQKLILLMLQRGNKPFYLSIGKMFVASLECFATLTSASISYFTVIYSTQ